ncbi:uncharacterized protein BDCG_08263 [Blastomyces dermatitidis ER-3]|uniref:SCP domain-containing protein n=1 Tax=Ajellomyces dermatitidis (strain ER-3 / ATCC MYA-2586) TaxID=559297 RepID=A0ABP2ESQ0_AJEDR|nr:uncharacterized protein BDCG_08263 [Blastomyces dermatitidis ER-3]EEQ84994.1 hypothetical protein BDCG_08263 [Blastomyces dermatitidis ER-3]
MRSSLLLSAFLAAGALSSPLLPRAYETDLTIVTVTEYVTAGAPTPTPTPPPAPAPDAPPKDEGSAPPPAPEPKPEPEPEPQPKPQPPPKEPVNKPPPPPPTYGNDYQSKVLYHHNIHRSNHSAPALTWANNLASYAHTVASKCVFEHDTSVGGESYGQNIGYGIPPQDIGKMITNMMYNDEAGLFAGMYGQANPDMSNFSKWGHFTQIVWKGTTVVGCATVKCSNHLRWNTVCNYGPPGNFGGRYAQNVLRPNGAQMAVA